MARAVLAADVADMLAVAGDTLTVTGHLALTAVSPEAARLELADYRRRAGAVRDYCRHAAPIVARCNRYQAAMALRAAYPMIWQKVTDDVIVNLDLGRTDR